jgi:hypothetical protein
MGVLGLQLHFAGNHNMTQPLACQGCPAFGRFCEGSAPDIRSTEDADRCRQLDRWVDALNGLALDMQLAPQPQFDPSIPSGEALPPFFPQLLNGLQVPAMITREAVVGVGIAKALTPRGKVSRRAIPLRYGPHDLRAQWGVDEGTTLLCIGNTLDGYLEELWRAQAKENAWGRLQALGFDAATSLNFSIYLDRPRMEHLVNIRRTWLTVQRMQETSRLIPIPHLQWATPLDLERRLDYAHPDLILAENVQLYREFLAEVRGDAPQDSPSRSWPRPSAPPIAVMLQRELGFDAGAALGAEDLLVADQTILDAFLAWVDTGQLDRGFQGSFPAWPCSERVPHPTLGQLLDAGADPVDAFLHLGHLARRVEEEIQISVGQAGY